MFVYESGGLKFVDRRCFLWLRYDEEGKVVCIEWEGGGGDFEYGFFIVGL